MRLRLPLLKRFFTSFALLSSLSFFAPQGIFGSENTQVLRIMGENHNKELLRNILNDGHEICGHGKNWFDIAVPETYAQNLKQQFRKRGQGSSIRVEIPNVDLLLAGIPVGLNSLGGGYHTVDETYAELKELAKANPEIARIEMIGKSFEGRDLLALKISDHVETDENEVAGLVMGCHHAREWISFEVPLYAANKLVNGYGKDPKVTRLVNEREIYIVPLVNPDGAYYSMNSQKYWRKNRRVNQGSSQVGVDLNRNYSFQWGLVGASNNPGSDTYHGTKPFSESESSAIRDLAKKVKFSGSISFHSYSELVLYPYGYAHEDVAPDEAILKKLAVEMSKFNKYTPEKSSDLYPAMGDSEDWIYGDLKALSYCIEIGRTFIPSPSEIPKHCELNYGAILHYLEKLPEYSLIVDHPDRDRLIASLDLETKGKLYLNLFADQLLKRRKMIQSFDKQPWQSLAEDRDSKMKILGGQIADELMTLAEKDLPRVLNFIDSLRNQEGEGEQWLSRNFEKQLQQKVQFEILSKPGSNSFKQLATFLKQ